MSKVVDKTVKTDKTVKSVLDLRGHLINGQNKKTQQKMASLVHPQTLDFGGLEFVEIASLAKY